MEAEPGHSHAYEFYPCLVDGQPASIYVDLCHERAEQRPLGADTRYTVAFQMRDAGPHGIGTSEEGHALDAAEEAVIARAREVGVTYVGRLRSHGVWESVLYGPAGHLDALHAAASANAGERRIQVRGVPDASWSYLDDQQLDKRYSYLLIAFHTWPRGPASEKTWLRIANDALIAGDLPGADDIVEAALDAAARSTAGCELSTYERVDHAVETLRKVATVPPSLQSLHEACRLAVGAPSK